MSSVSVLFLSQIKSLNILLVLDYQQTEGRHSVKII